MNRNILMILLITGIFTACNTPANPDQIDYANLKTLELQVTQEITESEDFLPGNLREVIVDSDDNILVSDWANNSITQFDADGNFVATVTESGRGPGELSNYFVMRQLSNDTLLVQQRSMEQEYFAKSGDGNYRFVRAVSPDRSSIFRKEVLGYKTDTTHYAKVTTTLESMQQAAKNENEYKNVVLAETSLSGKILTDSLQMLKEGTRHISETKRGYRMQQIPYRYDDQLVILDNGILIARPDSNSIYRYNDEQQLQQRIPFNVKPRPVTEEDLDYVMEDLDNKLRSELEERIADSKPPYLNVWATDRHIWLKTSGGEDGKQVVVLDFDGNPVGKFLLPEVDSIEAVRENYIYTIHDNPEQGNTIRKYEVKFRTA